MKGIHRVIGVLLFLGVVALCGMVLQAVATADGWGRIVACAAGTSRIEGAAAAVALLCVVSLYALTGINTQKRRKLLSFDNEGGTVSISTEAICDYIAKLGAEFPSIVRLTPAVVTGRNAIDLIIGVRVKAGPQIHEVCELLQQRVRESMTTGLGISQVRRVEVSVTDIVSEHKPR